MKPCNDFPNQLQKLGEKGYQLRSGTNGAKIPISGAVFDRICENFCELSDKTQKVLYRALFAPPRSCLQKCQQEDHDVQIQFLLDYLESGAPGKKSVAKDLRQSEAESLGISYAKAVTRKVLCGFSWETKLTSDAKHIIHEYKERTSEEQQQQEEREHAWRCTEDDGTYIGGGDSCSLM